MPAIQVTRVDTDWQKCNRCWKYRPPQQFTHISQYNKIPELTDICIDCKDVIWQMLEGGGLKALKSTKGEIIGFERLNG